MANQSLESGSFHKNVHIHTKMINALKFTELYDQIATYYPIFNRLKSVFKAVALGKWMYENKIKIDFK